MKRLRIAKEYLANVERRHQDAIQRGAIDNYYISLNELRAALDLIIREIEAEGRCEVHEHKGCLFPECN